jgi:hypothetical protein
VATYSSAVGRWAVVAVSGLACVAGVGCTHHGRDAPATAPDIPGVEFPVLPDVDPGVIHVGPAATSRLRNGLPRSVPNGFRLELDRCQLRAPGEWLVEGHVVLPKAGHPVTATLGLGFGHGDVSQTAWVHRVTFSESGRFAVALPGEAAHEGPRQPYDDSASDCEAMLLTVSVPIRTQVAFVSPTPARTPFAYSAPDDSIQALGIGAPLGDGEDPRTISLYTVWAGAQSTIAKVWVPVVAGERPALLAIKPPQPRCTTISVDIGPDTDDNATRVTVTTRMHCEAPPDNEGVVDMHEPVEGAAGFTWAHAADPGFGDIARRTIGPYEVWVQGEAAERDRVARIAANLTTRRNLAITDEPLPARPATLDAAVAAYLDDHDGLTERARFHYGDGWMIFLEDAGSAWNYRLLRAGHVASGWWIDASGGSGGSQTRCFSGATYSGAHGSRGAYAFSIAGNPRWRIQGLVDGRWRQIPSTHGVAFIDGTVPDGLDHSATFPGQQRPIDATGHVPGCFLTG